MTTAVVLSAFNGESVICEQLDSLRHQTRQPDAVYFRDDASKDNTARIVSQYIQQYGLTNWNLSINEKNKGWKKNFREMILAVKEDIVFPCDQDDIWHEKKIEEMAAVMEAHPEIDLLCCDYIPLYEDDTRRIAKAIEITLDDTGRLENVEFNERFMNVLRPGCTFAVRMNFCRMIELEWDQDLPHDAMLWRCASVKGTAWLLHRRLITWRRYNTSSSTPERENGGQQDKNRMMLDFYTGNNDSHLLFLCCLRRLIDNGTIRITPEKVQVLQKSEFFEKEQKEALLSHDPLRVLLCWLKYRRFYLSNKTVLANMLVTIKTRS